MTYEAVRARPDGDATVARLAKTASEYGYDGIVVRNADDATTAEERETIADTYGIAVVDGVEVTASDPSRASGFVGNHRPSTTVVVVRGGSTAINRFAVEQPAVDVLANPMAGEGDVNHVLAKAAVENDVRLEFDFANVLRADGGTRVRALRGLRKLRELVEHFDVPYVVSADPENHLHLRAPRDLTALGEVVGFDAADIETGLAEWQRIAERNRRRQSGDFVEPGVSLGPHEGDAERDD